MLESFPAALLAGAIFGFLTGLGVGGGSLLILWLTLVLGMDPQTARGINLMFFLPASILASVEPVVASIVGILAFGEPMNLGVVLGLACILISVYILR